MQAGICSLTLALERAVDSPNDAFKVVIFHLRRIERRETCQ